MNKALLAFALIALFSVASATRAETISSLWGAWKAAHKKQYAPSEESHRRALFLYNIEKIAQLNAENPTAKFALNQFADLTDAEFRAKYASGAFVEPATADEIVGFAANGALPESVDWRTKGAVTPVKNQGQCGSCWTFSTTGVIEGFYFIKNGKLLSFAEQQIVDCAKLAGFGCNGGWPKKAVNYASRNGLELEPDYPYTAANGKCQYESSKAIKTNSGVKVVTPKNSEQLKTALVSSPVAVVVQADEDAFRYYKSGVVTSGCSAGTNHAVLAVGYEKVNGVEAFIVKNSWGTTWGNQGYIAISTDQSINKGLGACGILTQPIIAV